MSPASLIREVLERPGGPGSTRSFDSPAQSLDQGTFLCAAASREKTSLQDAIVM